MQSWLNLLWEIPSFRPLILLYTRGPTDHHSVRLPTMVKIMLYLVISTPGRVPTSIYNRRDYRPSAIRRQEHISQVSLLYQFCCLNSTYYLALHGLVGLSRDPNRTAFSSLYETRTHLFEVAATETGLVPATTTLEYIDYSFL